MNFDPAALCFDTGGAEVGMVVTRQCFSYQNATGEGEALLIGSEKQTHALSNNSRDAFASCVL
jgi:hypothetical protein